MFSFRTRNQHCRRNFELKSPEFLFASDVLSGLAGSAARGIFEKSIQHGRINWDFRIGVDPGAVATERMHEKQFRGEGVGRNLRAAKSRDSLFQCCAGVHRLFRGDYSWSSSSSKRSDSKWVTSASTSDPSFPSIASVS